MKNPTRGQQGVSWLLLCLLAGCASPDPSRVGPPEVAPALPAIDGLGLDLEFAVPGDDTAFPGFLESLRARVPTLQNARGTRWPMILWDSIPVDRVHEPEVYRDMLARGLTLHVRMEEKFLPMAQALQAAGSPVIMMNGAGGPWPARLAGPPEVWQHQFEKGYTPQLGKSFWNSHVRPCLAIHDGWAIQADNVRAVLRGFRDAGVTVDAVWMDWEGDPQPVAMQYDQASRCTRCRAMLPAWVLASPENCMHYCQRLRLYLLDTYLAAPVLQVFPRASITNWMVVFSSRDRPVRHWNHGILPPSAPGLMNGTNPVAYGNTAFWRLWQPQWTLDGEHVDQLFTYLLLQQISADAANREAAAPEKACIPWVSRWCPDDTNPNIPVLSRARYREILRHLWLRGADGMQLFNSSWSRKGHKERMFTEVEDAVAVYDEMLAHRTFLDEGVVLCTDMPELQDDGPIWSGLRHGDAALIRAFKQGGGTTNITLEIWSGQPVTLAATAEGVTYRLDRHDSRIAVTAVR